ncbi:IclR family transcriptional regulator [Halonotius pteroides]|uniref:IclR family transcriptional regulator n=1 Tax=Halonotius pteroides TaxID=268735 RepID=A0A3A6Q3J6_9EURY|nr:IclR family transcriptional regulator [Halonotius pteroides]RJX48708.1 IclR family transcriptional regulator [Halonotius pteroides]
MVDTDNKTRTLQTVSTSLEVLSELKENDTLGVTELATRLDISKSSAHAHLATLEDKELVINRNGTYELAVNLFTFGQYVREQNLLYQHGKSQVDKLADETSQYVHIVTEENGWGINLYQIKGETRVGGDYQQNKPQRRDHLHYTASGKAILAAFPADRVREIIESNGLPKRTSNTITSERELFEELESIRERGYSYNDEEEIEGFRAVGTAVRGPGGEVLGSLSISGPTSFMQGDRYKETIPERLINAANVIEVNLNMNKSDR